MFLCYQRRGCLKLSQTMTFSYWVTMFFTVIVLKRGRRSKYHVTPIVLLSIPRQIEFLGLKLDFNVGQSLIIMGCYRPPSACNEALTSLFNQLVEVNSNEIILTGDLNLDWLTSSSEALKSICDSLNLAQLINSPTRPKLKCTSRSSLLDLFLTNNPHKYTSTGVFANDLSDHCAIGIVRNAKLPKPKPQILIKRT